MIVGSEQADLPPEAAAKSCALRRAPEFAGSFRHGESELQDEKTTRGAHSVRGADLGIYSPKVLSLAAVGEWEVDYEPHPAEERGVDVLSSVSG